MFLVIGSLHVLQEAHTDILRQRLFTIIIQSLNCRPLQRCPAVRRIPLLTVVDVGRRQSTFFQQLSLHRVSSAGGVLFRCRLQIQWEQGSRRQLRTDGGFLPVIIGIEALLIVPKIAVDRRLTFFRQPVKFLHRIVVFRHFIGASQRLLQMEHQRIQIDRNNSRGMDGGEIARLIKPARAEVPTGGGAGT